MNRVRTFLVALGVAMACVACHPSGGGAGPDCRETSSACGAGAVCQQLADDSLVCVALDAAGGSDGVVGGGDGGGLQPTGDAGPTGRDADLPAVDAAPSLDAAVDGGASLDANLPRDADRPDAGPSGDAAAADRGPSDDDAAAADRGPPDDDAAPDMAIVPADAAAPDMELPAPDAGRLGGPGAPCDDADDCAHGGACDDGLPDGACIVPCEGPCPGDAICQSVGDEPPACHAACEGDVDCRVDWICVDGGCQAGCALRGCPPGEACDANGRCRAGCVPRAEICDRADQDCDGEVDEGTLNACGACGPVPPEVCNGEDDDCDGRIDEGRLNACGACGPVPPEVCNGADDDCDGRTDEGLGCGGPDLFDITFSGAILRIAENDGVPWDGLDRQIDADALAGYRDALSSDDAYNALLAFYDTRPAPVSQRPDASGTLRLSGTGVTAGEVVLVERSDTFTPGWGVTIARQPIADDARLTISLVDEDVFADDPIGTVVISAAALRTALAAGETIGVRVSTQGLGHIAFVALRVRASP